MPVIVGVDAAVRGEVGRRDEGAAHTRNAAVDVAQGTTVVGQHAAAEVAERPAPEGEVEGQDEKALHLCLVGDWVFGALEARLDGGADALRLDERALGGPGDPCCGVLLLVVLAPLPPAATTLLRVRTRLEEKQDFADEAMQPFRGRRSRGSAVQVCVDMLNSLAPSGRQVVGEMPS